MNKVPQLLCLLHLTKANQTSKSICISEYENCGTPISKDCFHTMSLNVLAASYQIIRIFTADYISKNW